MSRSNPVVRALALLVAAGLLLLTAAGCSAVEGAISQLVGERSMEPVDAFCIDLQVRSEADELTSEVLEQTRTIIESRVNATGVAEPIVVTQGSDRIAIALPGIAAGTDAADEVLALIEAPGVLEFMPVPAELQGQVEEGPLPEAMAEIEPLFTGAEVTSAVPEQDETIGQPIVSLELSETGARRLDEYAEAHFGEQFAIVVDDEVVTAPFIQATRFEGQAQISGGPSLTPEAVARLLTILRFGPLPVDIEVLSAGPCGTLDPASVD